MFKLFSTMFVLCLSLTTVTAQPPKPKEATATVSGTVTLNSTGVRNAVVSLQAQNQPVPQSPLRTTTDADGRFRFNDVTAGQYMINALTPGFYSTSESQYGLPGKTLNVGKGETIENIELPLKRGAVITGRVTDENDEPIVETNVQLQRVGDRVPLRQNMLSFEMHRTDDRGIYRIYGLPPGKYHVSVGLPLQTGYMSFQSSRVFFEQTFHPDVTEQAQAKVVEVDEGQVATDVDIRIGKRKNAYEVAGRVVDAQTGQPVGGVGLGFGLIHPSTGRIIGWTSGGNRTDASGEFQLLGLQSGKYSIVIRSTGDKDEYYSDPVTVEVTKDDLAGIEIRAQRGAVLGGWAIIEGTTDPAILARRSQIRLTAVTENPSLVLSQRGAQVRADGSFQITGVPAGPKRLAVSANATELALLRIEQNGTPIKDNLLEVRAGEQINNLRFVFAHSTAAIRGRMEFVGGVLPKGTQIIAMVQPAGQGPTNGKSSPVDARGHFVLEGLLPGEYVLRFSTNYPQLSTQELSLITRKITAHTQRVFVTKDSQIPLTITIDLSQEGR